MENIHLPKISSECDADGILIILNHNRLHSSLINSIMLGMNKQTMNNNRKSHQIRKRKKSIWIWFISAVFVICSRYFCTQCACSVTSCVQQSVRKPSVFSNSDQPKKKISSTTVKRLVGRMFHLSVGILKRPNTLRTSCCSTETKMTEKNKKKTVELVRPAGWLAGSCYNGNKKCQRFQQKEM